jgi:hypothetical protein
MDTKGKLYSPKEVAEYYEKTLRTIQRYCYIQEVAKTSKGYMLSYIDLKKMANYFYPNEYPSNLTTFLNSLGIWHEAEHDKALSQSKHIRVGENQGNTTTPSDISEIPINDAVELVSTYAIKQGLVPKFYTEEEYQELVGQLERLEAVEENTSELKEQIAYLRESNKELREMLKDGLGSIQKAITAISERNTLEAKEKGLLK